MESKKKKYPDMGRLSRLFAEAGSVTYKMVSGRKADTHYVTWYDSEGNISESRATTRTIQVSIHLRTGFDPSVEVSFGAHQLGSDSPKDRRSDVPPAVLTAAKKALSDFLIGAWISDRPLSGWNIAKKSAGAFGKEVNTTKLPTTNSVYDDVGLDGICLVSLESSTGQGEKPPGTGGPPSQSE